MGVFDRVGKSLGGLWDAVEAPPQFVWDVLRGVKDEGLSAGLLATTWGSFTSRGGQAIGGLIGPNGFGGTIAGALPEQVRAPIRQTIGTGESPDQRGLGGEEFFGHGILGFFEATGRELIREPLTTLSHVSSLATTDESIGDMLNPFNDKWGAFLDGDSWRQGHQIAQGRSLGQSIALAWQTKDILDTDEITKAQATGAYKFWSGAWDAAARIFIDADTVVGGFAVDAIRGGTAAGKLRNAEAFATSALDELETLKTARRGRAAITEEILGTAENALEPGVGRKLKVQATTPAMKVRSAAAEMFGETVPGADNPWIRAAQTLFKDERFEKLENAINGFEQTNRLGQRNLGDLYEWAHRTKTKLLPSELEKLSTTDEVWELVVRKVAEKRKYASISILDDAGQVVDDIALNVAPTKTVLTSKGLERAAKKLSYEELTRRDAAWATWERIRAGGWDKAMESATGRVQDTRAGLAYARESFMQSRQWRKVSADILDRSGLWALPTNAPTAITAQKADEASDLVPGPSAVSDEMRQWGADVNADLRVGAEKPVDPGVVRDPWTPETLANLPESYRQRHVINLLMQKGELTLDEYTRYMDALDARFGPEAATAASTLKARPGHLKPEHITKLEDYVDGPIYRQTTAAEAEKILGSRTDPLLDEFFATNDRELALSQAGGDVLIEWAPILKGSLSTAKPVWEEAYAQGAAEFVLKKNQASELRDAVRKVHFAKASDLSASRRKLLGDRGWQIVENSDGSLDVINPAFADAVPRVSPDEVIPPRDIPLSERPFVDPDEIKSLAESASLVREGTMTLGRRIERIRDRYFHNTADGEQIATWLANAHSQAELDAVMRVALGEFKNLDTLQQLNPAIYQDMMRVFTRRMLQRTLPWEDALRYHDEEFKLFNQVDDLAANPKAREIAGDELQEVIDQLAVQANDPEFVAKELAKLRQAVEDSHFLRTGAGRGGAFREAVTYSRTFQSRGNIARVFVDMAAPHILEVDDPMVVGKIRRHLRDAGIEGPEAETILGQWATIRDNPTMRQDLLREIQELGINSLAKKHGIDDPDEITFILENVRKAAAEGSLLLRSAARYAGIGPGGKELSRVPLVDAVTGEVSHTYLPMTPAQLNKAEVMPNFRQIDKSMAWWGTQKRKYPAMGKATEAPGMLMEELNKAWKVAALIRPAWPMRVVFDEQVRMVGVLGLMEALSGKVSNFRDLRMNYMRDMFPLKDPDRNVQWMSVDETGRLALTKEPLSPTANKAVDIKKAQRGSAAVGTIIGGLIGGTPGAIAGGLGGYIAGRRGGQLANGLEYLHHSHTRKVALDGYRAAAAYGHPGDVANLFHDQSSAQRQMDQLRGITPSEIYREMRLDPRRWRYYTPGESGYEIFWNRATNYQFSNSEFTKLLWNDEITDEAIVHWLTEGKGQSTLRSMPKERQRNVDEWVANARDFTRQLIPETTLGQELRAAKARGEAVTMAQLQESLGPDWAGQVGSVHGMEFIELSDNRSPVVKIFTRKVDNIMRHLGTTPTDTLSRHPYFDKVYRQKVSQEISKLEAGADGMVRLSQAEIDAISRQARRSSLTEVRSLLYDLAEQSHFAQAVSFLSPFYMAWQEVITRYAGIAYENPVFASRALKVYNSAGKADLGFMGIDTYSDESTGNEFIRIVLPDSARALLKHGIFAGAIDSQGKMLFDKKGINMLSQGVPGAGPIASVPISWAVKDRPELEESLRVLFPYGLPQATIGGAAEAFLPTGARRALSLGMDDRSMAAVKARILQTKITKAAEAGDPYDLSDKLVVDKLIAEVDEESKALGRLRVASAFVSPLAISYQSPYQEFIDEFYKLRDEDYLTAAEKFREKHGDAFFTLTQSFSKVNDGVQATYSAEAVRDKYRELIEAYPDYGSLIVGDEGGGLGVQFVRAIYERQFQEKISVGDPRKRREMIPLNVVATDPDRRLGWIKFSRFNDWLTDQMDRAGITNLSVKKAQPLLAIKRAYVGALAEQHPSWYLDYSDVDDNKWSNRMSALRAIVNEGPKELTQRPDIRGLREYLSARGAIEGVLAQRKAAGGSGNLGANENADVRQTWETMTLALSERNLAFSDLYSRWLENDPVSEPSWAA